MYNYIGKVFDKYDVNFPLDNQLIIIIGANGTGKTKSLECLNKYLLKNDNCKTKYLSEYRTRDFKDEDINALEVLFAMEDKEYEKEHFNYYNDYCKVGEYIRSGKEQFLNMLYHASKCENGNLLIDFPEANLHISTQEKLIDILLSFNLKRLVIVTHSPCIVRNHYNEMINIENIVKLR